MNMKSNRSILRKYAAILALAVSAIVLLPEDLFAQGAVVGYVIWPNVNTDALFYLFAYRIYILR